MKENNKHDADYISIITNKVCAKVKLDEIEMLEQDGRKLVVYTDEEEYICYDKVESLAYLLVNRSFYRAKKGLVINFDKVLKVQAQEILFESGRLYCIGRNNYIRTKTAFKNYLLGYPPFVRDATDSRTAEREEDYSI